MTTVKPGLKIEGLEAKPLPLSGLTLFRAETKNDARGHITPTFNHYFFQQMGIDFPCIHENHCYTHKAGTIRGFHYQLPPHGQPKLIRVTHGRILDVNVDLRRSSPTYGQHALAELSPEGWNQILVPEGFAHCYLTLSDEAEVIFKLGAGFAPDYARGLAWNDPDLHIPWPVEPQQVTVLERDLNRPRFRDLSEEDTYP